MMNHSSSPTPQTPPSGSRSSSPKTTTLPLTPLSMANMDPISTTKTRHDVEVRHKLSTSKPGIVNLNDPVRDPGLPQRHRHSLTT
ncbi:hypothetical protein GJ744_008607 [Endocarpon pusillum]|uniref:Uncharacterized protein n=1 Tax=Endocarpon pusillum TaxID=364733 RepID=A0A8H7AH28_9EURO|nr:hypothetical protein GJ744_008607 [Endocarpon pusillum]